MRTRLLWVIVFQLISCGLLTVHRHYLATESNEMANELGRQQGEIATYEHLRSRGVALPDGLRQLPNKDLIDPLSDGFQHLFVFLPAIALQGLALVILVGIRKDAPTEATPNPAEWLGRRGR